MFYKPQEKKITNCEVRRSWRPSTKSNVFVPPLLTDLVNLKHRITAINLIDPDVLQTPRERNSQTMRSGDLGGQVQRAMSSFRNY